MNKTELIKNVAQNAEISQKEATVVYNCSRINH